MTESHLRVLWLMGQERRVPLDHDDMAAHSPALLSEDCPACGEQLEGRRLAALAIGPGSDRGKQVKHREGTPYAAVALAFHAQCLGIA